MPSQPLCFLYFQNRRGGGQLTVKWISIAHALSARQKQINRQTRIFMQPCACEGAIGTEHENLYDHYTKSCKCTSAWGEGILQGLACWSETTCSVGSATVREANEEPDLPESKASETQVKMSELFVVFISTYIVGEVWVLIKNYFQKNS